MTKQDLAVWMIRFRDRCPPQLLALSATQQCVKAG